MRDNYLLFPFDGEPALLVQSCNHVPNAQEISVAPDTNWGGADRSEAVAAEIKRRGLEHRVRLISGRASTGSNPPPLAADTRSVRRPADARGNRILRLSGSRRRVETSR